MTIGKNGSLLITYKNIMIWVDPNADSATLAAQSQNVDYVLLTDAGQRHFGSTAQAAFRKNIKILASPNEASKVKAAGFTDVKALTAGQRIMLKKNNGSTDAFVFVMCAQNTNPSTQLQVNSYLLEFDNGRNLFVSGELTNADGLREFVYGLRDDGKELYAGIFYLQPDVTAQTIAQIASLVQPKAVILTQTDVSGVAAVDEASFHQALQTELYDGPAVILREGRQIPF